MKTIVPGAALALIFLSWSAVAEELNSAHAKAPTEEQCKAMGEQHGMSGDKMAGWMKKCMDMSRRITEDMGKGDMNKGDMGGMHDMNDTQQSNDMQDLEDGDRDMGDNNE